MTWSVYDRSAVRAYTMLYGAIKAIRGWKGEIFIRVEPAGHAGWHAFTNPNGMMLSDYLPRKAER